MAKKVQWWDLVSVGKTAVKTLDVAIDVATGGKTAKALKDLKLGDKESVKNVGKAASKANSIETFVSDVTGQSSDNLAKKKAKTDKENALEALDISKDRQTARLDTQEKQLSLAKESSQQQYDQQVTQAQQQLTDLATAETRLGQDAALAQTGLDIQLSSENAARAQAGQSMLGITTSASTDLAYKQLALQTGRRAEDIATSEARTNLGLSALAIANDLQIANQQLQSESIASERDFLSRDVTLQKDIISQDYKMYQQQQRINQNVGIFNTVMGVASLAMKIGSFGAGSGLAAGMDRYASETMSNLKNTYNPDIPVNFNPVQTQDPYSFSNMSGDIGAMIGGNYGSLSKYKSADSLWDNPNTGVWGSYDERWGF